MLSGFYSSLRRNDGVPRNPYLVVWPKQAQRVDHSLIGALGLEETIETRKGTFDNLNRIARLPLLASDMPALPLGFADTDCLD